MNHFNTPSPEDQLKFDPAEIFEVGLFNHHIANTAYPIKHGETMGFYRPRNDQGSLSKELKQTMINTTWSSYDDIGVYVHVPFCDHRCGFCDYAVVDPKLFHNALSHENYFRTLGKEMEIFHNLYGMKSINGFDIGGGTPSAVAPKYIDQIINNVHKYFHVPSDINISIETTPKIAAEYSELPKLYKSMGIDRISMGVQTINPKILAQVGRSNTSIDRNVLATKHIRDAGFDSFNIDVMYGLPNMTTAQIQATMDHVMSLAPDHFTMYRTRYKGTALEDRGYKIELEGILEQGDVIKNNLDAHGYHAMTGKNTFSKTPGSSGASAYLTNRVVYGTPYVGFGLGSQSLSPTMLSYNQGVATKDRSVYQALIEKGQLPIQDMYHLSKEMSAGKFVSVSFYFGGIHLPSFEKHFQCKVDQMFPHEVKFVLEEGLMHYEGDRLQLTKKGVRNYNGTIALFYSGAIKKYLVERMQTQLSLAESLVANEQELCEA